MKSDLTVIVITLHLLCKANGGLIDAVYGTVANTTQGLKQDAKNLWTFGQDFVVGEVNSTVNSNEGKDGFIGGLFHTFTNSVQSVREKVHGTIFGGKNQSEGFIKNLYNGAKNRVEKVKGYIMGNDNNTESNNDLNNNYNKDGREGVDFVNYTSITHSIAEFNDTLFQNIDGSISDVQKGMENIGDKGRKEIDNVNDKLNTEINSIIDKGKEGMENVRQELKDETDEILDIDVRTIAKGENSTSRENNLMNTIVGKIQSGANDFRDRTFNLIEDNVEQNLMKYMV